MSAAAELFVRDGYEKTSVNGIVEKAGCSVGAFYGHFKSKQELASLIWAESTIEIIKESVEKGSRIKEFDAFIDYLIMRSISSYSNKLTNVLFKHISYTAEVRSNMAQWAARYTGMIRNMLHQYAPELRKTPSGLTPVSFTPFLTHTRRSSASRPLISSSATMFSKRPFMPSWKPAKTAPTEPRQEIQ